MAKKGSFLDQKIGYFWVIFGPKNGSKTGPFWGVPKMGSGGGVPGTHVKSGNRKEKRAKKGPFLVIFRGFFPDFHPFSAEK